MTMIHIRKVETSRDLDLFLRLPQLLHPHDPHRVPPIRAWSKMRLSPYNPFFKEAELKLWLAFKGSEALGSISALRDRRHEKKRREPVAFFGFFESVDDPSVAEALMEQATIQARTWGARIIRGPRNITRVEENGILIQGHDTAPPMLAGHNPPYYRQLVEQMGFVPHHDLLAYDSPLFDTRGRPLALPPRLEEQADSVDITGLEVRDATFKHPTRDLHLAHQVFVEAFRDVPENTPMPRGQFISLGWAFILLTDRRLLQLATVNGEAAGFALCFPELNEAVKHANGEFLPTGLVRFLLATRRIETASFKLIGVLPAYRSTGLHALMIRRAVDAARRVGFNRLEASVIDQRNERMRRVIESTGMKVYRRYRIYEKQIR